MCVLTNERYKTYQTVFFHSVAWVMPPGWDFGALGVPRGGGGGGSKKKFNHGHVAYQIDGDDKQNRMQVTFPS